MNKLVPGTLVRTKYLSRHISRDIDTNLWEHIFYESYNTFSVLKKISKGKSEPYLYIGPLQDDQRFAEILVGEQRIAVRFEMLEKYE